MATSRPDVMSKTRLLSLPLTDRCFAPGPLIVTLSVMSNSPLVSAMVPCSPLANAMVSGPRWALAAATAARRESGPLSLRFRTVKVLGKVRSSSCMSCGRKCGGRGVGRRRPGLHHGERNRPNRKAANMETSKVGEEATAVRAQTERRRPRCGCTTLQPLLRPSLSLWLRDQLFRFGPERLQFFDVLLREALLRVGPLHGALEVVFRLGRIAELDVAHRQEEEVEGIGLALGGGQAFLQGGN